MKNLIFLILLFVSCTTYKELVTVYPVNFIPDGTKSIILTDSIEIVKQAFKSKGIMLKSLEGGFETEEILLDEGTRAMYKIHEFDNQIRITAFWGITTKVKSDMVFWVGHDYASAYDVHSWDQVIYNKYSKRPKKVFDYAVQIIISGKLKYSFK